jgi:hypothetical protein
MKKILWTILCACFISAHLFATSSPKKGVKPPAGFAEEIKKMQGEYASGFWAQEIARKRAMRQSSMGMVSAALPLTDTVRIPIMAGRFQDLASHYTRQQLQTQLYDGPTATGTITDYYTENSYGQMYVTGSVAEWNTVPRAVSYYYLPNTPNLNWNGFRDFTIDLLMETDTLFDFSPYVNPTIGTDGYYHVPLLAVIHAGAGAEAGAPNIWSHRTSFRSRLRTRYFDPNEKFIAKDRVIVTSASSAIYLTNDTYMGVAVVIDGDYTSQPIMTWGASLKSECSVTNMATFLACLTSMIQMVHQKESGSGV